MKLVDPIKLLQERAATSSASRAVALRETHSEVPYELPLEPPPGTRVQRLTVGSTYRAPIPVLFDPATRTTYPITNAG